MRTIYGVNKEPTCTRWRIHTFLLLCQCRHVLINLHTRLTKSHHLKMSLLNILPPWWQQHSQQTYVTIQEAEGEKLPLTESEWTSSQLQKTRSWYRRPQMYMFILICLLITENIFLFTKSLSLRGNEAFPVCKCPCDLSSCSTLHYDQITANRVYSSVRGLNDFKEYVL